MEIITQKDIKKVAYNLLVRSATKYPANYLKNLLRCLKKEKNWGSKHVIFSILQNIIYASKEPCSICQDTGIPTFHIYFNPQISIKGDVQLALAEATAMATEDIPIRKNVIEPFSFHNPGNNTGWGVPFVHFHYDQHPGPMRIRVELKGFGGEIKSSVDWIFTSTSNMENAVLAYVLNNVLLTKGENCIPGYIGVGVGGYLSEAVFNAKNATYRELTKKTELSVIDRADKSLVTIEKRLFKCINRLGLGPMGSGGDSTTMGVYLERRGTQTALAPVAVAHQCWASRGSEALIREKKIEYITPHVEITEADTLQGQLSQEISSEKGQGKVYELDIPINEADIKKLRVWDVVYLNGIICTSRDRAHGRLVEFVRDKKHNKIPAELRKNGVIYHSGPVIEQKPDQSWCITAAGPTTSSRFTDDGAFLVDQGLIKVAIGKGDMGKKMINALTDKGVYLKAVGGCAVIYKRMIIQTTVEWLDLGYPEAIWILQVKHFGPLIVGIDTQGNSLTQNVMENVYENAREIYKSEGLDPHKRYIQYPTTPAGFSLEEIIENAKMN